MARGDGSGGVQLRLRPVRGALLTKQEEQDMDDDARLRHAIRISMRDVGGAPASAADAKGSEGAGGSQAAADGSRATVAANGGAGGGRRDNDAAQLPAAAKQEANDATIEEDLAERTQPPCGVSKHADQGEGGGDAPSSPPGGGSAAAASPAAAPRTTPSRARQTPARYRLEWDSDFVSPAPRKEGKKRTAAAAAGKDAARSPRPQKRKPTLGLSNAKDSRVLKLGSALIGHTVEVYWPKEKQWYEGVICGYNAVTKKHLIEYYDGDSQLEDLSTEEFNFLPPMPMPPSNLKGDIPHPPVDDMGSENLCAHCMKADVDDDESGTTMLCCESCPLVFHMECLEPPLTEAPAGVWLCPLCEAARALLEKGKQARALRAANQPMLEAVPPANPDRNKLRGKKKSSATTQQTGLVSAPDDHELSSLGIELIGHRVEVFWPEEKEFFEGVVTGYDAIKGTHTVGYVDGDEPDCFVLREQNVRWLSPKPVMHPADSADAPLVPRIGEDGYYEQCGVCGLDSTPDDALVICETCPMAVHTYRCAGLEAVPSGEWHCTKCADALQILAMEQAAYAAAQNAAEMAAKVGDTIWERDVRGRSRTILPEKISQGELMALGSGGALLPVEDDKWRGPDALDFIMMDFVERKSLGGYRIKVEINRNVVVGTVGEYTPKTASHVIYPDDPPAGSAPVQRAKLGKAKFEWIGPTYPGRPKQHQASATRKKLQALEATKAKAAKRSAVAARAKTAQADKRKVGLVVVTEEEQAAKEAADVAEAAELGEHLQDIMTSGRPARKAALGVSATVMALKDEDASDDVGMARASKKRTRDIAGGNAGETKKAKHKRKLQKRERDIAGGNAGETKEAKHKRKLQELQSRAQAAAKSLEEAARGFELARSGAEAICGDAAASVDSAADYEPRYAYREVNLHAVDPKLLVGRPIKVYWAGNMEWFRAIVLSYNDEGKFHNIAYYETEEKEALNLCDPREDDGTDIRIRVLLSVGMDLKEPLPESLFQTNGGSVYNEHHGLVSDTDADAADDVGDPGNANGAAPAVPAPAPAAPAADAAAAGQGARETTILASGELAVIDEQVLSLADGCNDIDEPLPKLAQGALAATGNKTVQRTVQPEQLENQPKLQGVQFEVNPQHRGSPVLQQHASIDKQPEQLLPQEQQQGERRHKQQQEEQTKQQLEQEQQWQGGEEQQQDRQEGEQEKKQPSQAEQVQETGACGEKLASAPSEVSSGPPEGAVAPATKEEPAERMSMRPGDVVWARYSKGSAPHPAIVLMIDDKEDTNNENSKRRYAHPPAKLADCKYGNGGKPVAIQYFGTYEFMNAEPGWVIDFWSGVKSGLHLIAKKETYVVGIEQMVAYLESNTLQVEMGGEDYDEYLTFCDQDGYLEHITDDKEYLRAREERLALKVARAAAGADDDTETDADDFMPSSGKRHRSRKGAQTGKGGPDSPAPGRRSRAPGTPLSVKRRKPDELPLELGLLRVHALGRVVVAADDQAAWHTAKFIYPLGYRATRMYASQVAPTQQVEYSMEVRCSHPLDASYFINDVDDMDGIDDEHLDEEELEARRLRHTYREPVRQALPEGSAPVFVVKPPAGHGEETQGRTPTEAWKKVVDIIGATVAKLADKGTKEEMNVRAATQMRHDQAAKLFGFDHPKLCRLQQRLPGVMMLKNFMSWCDPAMKVKVRQAQKEAEKTKAEAKRWAKTAAPFKPLEYGFRAECCAVCYEDADTQENLLIQCSKCRILVHMDCVGVEKEPEGLWYCQLCQAQRPDFAPPAWCKLCPVAGGALVPTACSNWAHIACANWVPEVYMAPADSADKGAPGSTSEADSVVQIGKVPRARLALACEVCGVDHGAPIQCCIDRCFNAFHPLCARAAGYKLEVHVEDRRADDGDAPFGLTKNGNKRRFDRRRSKSGQAPEVQRNFVQRELLEGADIGNGAPAAIEMRAYCSKHTPVGERGEPVAGVWSAAPQIDEAERQILGPRPGTPCDDTRAGCSTDAGDVATVGRATPPLLLPMTTAAEATAKAAEDAAVAAKARENEDECARTRPFNWKLKRGFQEPEAVAGFLAKRSYLARVPFIQQGLERAMALESISGMPGKRPMPRALRDYMERAREAAGLGRALSQKDRYHTMMRTLPMRLAFGKSAIHGWGVFAKVPHAVGEFVIEYVGDLVRSAVADMRERQLYNEMVGTGTYIMKVNEEHVVDATRAGNIAHLMNHSCDANCASRIVTVDGVDHPVVFAKRPLAAGEELTYDYRFHSDDERLPCNCGAALCRGFVNFKLQPQELLDANEVARVPAAQVQLLDAAQSKEALDEHIKVLAASDKRIVMMAMETEAKQQAEADAKLQVEEAKAKRRAEEADQLARAAAESAAAAEPEAQAAAQGAVQASAQPTAQQLLSGECVHTPDALEHEQIPGAATYPVLQAPHAVTGEASLPQYAAPLARASPQYAEASLAQHGVPVDASGLPCVPLAGTPVLSGLSSGQAPPPLQARSPLLAEHAALARHQAVVVQQLLQGAPPAKSPPKQ